MKRRMPGLRVAPDAAHSNWEFPEGIGVGELQHPSDSVSYLSSPVNIKIRVQARVPSMAPHLENIKKGKTTGQTEDFRKYTWNTQLRRDENVSLLYVFLDPGEVGNISRTAFMNLLDCADEVLHCGHVILCLKVDESDASCDKGHEAGANAEDVSHEIDAITPESCYVDLIPTKISSKMCMAVRIFMFLGFQPLAPEDDFAYSTPDYLSLICDV